MPDEDVDMDQPVAGPSNHQNSLFLPPPVPPPPRAPISATDDLLTRFGLFPAYERHVSVPEPNPNSNSNPSAKGKEKERDNYKHLIKQMPGKHSSKKDDYLMTIMHVPEKQIINIELFSQNTKTNAFAVNADGLRGWNINTLIAESPQAKEDKRKRKELRRQQKLQQQQLQAQRQQQSSAAPTPGPVRHPPAPPDSRGIKRAADGEVSTVTMDPRDIKRRKMDGSHLPPTPVPLQQPTPL